jgi:hypothetical protein
MTWPVRTGTEKTSDILVAVSVGLMDLFGSWASQLRTQQARRRKIQQGVEAIVDRVDPRLRGLSGYRARLMPALETAVVAVDSLIASLPRPLEVTREGWAADPLLHAYFTSVRHMQEAFDSSPALRDFLTSAAATGGTEIYAMLSMRMERRTRFGMEMHGESLLADQQQVAVGFDDYRIGAVATDEAGFRQALRRRVLEEVATRAMQRIMGMRTRREAMTEEKARLQWKLKIHEMRKTGIGGLWHDEAGYERHIAALREQIGDAQIGLDELVAHAGNIEHFLEMTAEEFEKAGETMRIDSVALHLDEMNVERSAQRGGRELLLNQFHVGRRRPRVVQAIRFSPSFVSIDTGRALRRAARALGVR